MKTKIQKALLAATIIANFIMVAPAQAADKHEAPIAELKMVGKTNHQPVFQLDVANTQKDQFFILIKDQEGVVLYEETVSAEKISRRFQLNTEDLAGATLTVEVTSRKTARSTSFEIVSNVKQVYEAEVISKSTR